MEAISLHQDIPFSRRVFELMIEKFHLPSSTPWAFGTDGSHFQRYNLDDRNVASRRTGNISNGQIRVDVDKISQGSP